MEESTIETDSHAVPRETRLSPADRVGAWFYTGPVGRLVSFSIDLGLSFAALGAWSAKRAWRRLMSDPRP